MADVINLRLARKTRNRTRAAERAAENRALHGLSGADRKRQQADAERQASQLEAHRREPD